MRFRGTRIGALAPVVLLAGCGYVGEPLPPALKRPVRVTDLSAAERGSKIAIQFTLPKVTTEDEPIAGDPDIELRISPGGSGALDPNAFAQASERITGITRAAGRATAEVPVAKYTGQAVVIGVRVNGPQGRNAGWSNFVALRVVAALPTPAGLTATNELDSVRLTWQGAAPEFRVFRKLAAEVSPALAGSVTQTAYVDAAVEYGKAYQYFVQAVQKTDTGYAESEISPALAFTPADQFAPAAPTGLTAIPAIRSMELVWQRNTEKDLASYSVYRNGEKLATGLTAPAYSDATVTAGGTYQYQISASDMAGNESAKSAAVTSVMP